MPREAGQLTRKGFILLGGTGIGYLAARNAFDWLVNGIPPVDTNVYKFPHPWYLESSLGPDRPPIITPSTGHYEAANYIRGNSILVEIAAKKSANEMYSAETPDSLSSVLESTWRHTIFSIDKHHPGFKTRVSAQEYNLLAARVFAYTLASIFNPYNTLADLEQIGIDTSMTTEEDTQLYGKYALWRLYPKILPLEGVTGSPLDKLLMGSGADRTVHLTGHMSLVLLTGALKYINSPELQRIPPALSLGLSQLNQRDIASYIISMGAGILWEAKETFRGKGAQSGFLEDSWKLDLFANTIGAELARLILNRVVTSDIPLESISDLLDPLRNIEENKNS